ncbi:copper resistance protein [Amycolatopsis acidicola]|uniref:Copper resistance protein n=1 Tax=Amycolatopsis acidicola TaxID=2596893 RepID=A0A5N0VKV1_9PSEU|nr:CopD family protein [Amycolatopsis acidicola]KAA9166845.1 copper resistance protein [Amycolatopsis acidicola]
MDLTPAKALYIVARAIDYFGMTLFLGGLLFLAFLWKSGADHGRARKVVVVGWVLGFVGTVAAVGLEGAWIAQRPPTDFLDWDLISQVLDVHFGQIWFARALLWLLGGVVLAQLLQRGRRAAGSLAWRTGLAAIGFGLLRTTGMTGHASESARPVLAQFADFLHVLGICAWLGGLAMLLFGLLSRREPDELASVLPRYSKLAMGSVLLIVAAGVVLTWQTLGSVSKLFSTDYGRTLLVKIVVLLVVLLIAQGSRGWVNRRLDFAVVLRGQGGTVRPFVYSVAAETVLVIVVLVAASLLVTASPGR